MKTLAPLTPPPPIPRVSLPHCLLGFIGAGISLYTVKLHNLAKAGLDTGCGISASISCDTVLGHPKYGAILGIPLGFFGAFFFGLVVITAISTGPGFRPRAVALQRLLVATVGLLTSLALEYVMWAIIKKGCLYCMATHFITLLNFLWAVLQYRKANRVI